MVRVVKWALEGRQEAGEREKKIYFGITLGNKGKSRRPRRLQRQALCSERDLAVDDWSVGGMLRIEMQIKGLECAARCAARVTHTRRSRPPTTHLRLPPRKTKEFRTPWPQSPHVFNLSTVPPPLRLVPACQQAPVLSLPRLNSIC